MAIKLNFQRQIFNLPRDVQDDLTHLDRCDRDRGNNQNKIIQRNLLIWIRGYVIYGYKVNFELIKMVIMGLKAFNLIWMLS